MALSLHCFPGEDERFQDDVRRAVERAAAVGDTSGHSASVRNERDLLTRVRDELRQSHPAAVISVRHALAAISTGEPPTWYAYRDGTLLSGRDEGQREAVAGTSAGESDAPASSQSRANLSSSSGSSAAPRTSVITLSTPVSR